MLQGAGLLLLWFEHCMATEVGRGTAGTNREKTRPLHTRLSTTFWFKGVDYCLKFHLIIHK